MTATETSPDIPSILVVDDTSDNLRLLKRVLESGQCEVRLATDGDLALQSVAASRPDLILLDVNMPDIDGFEVCRRLKADERTKDIPVIFLTALDSPDNEGHGLELGAVDYIAKPFYPALVRARVWNHLRFARQRRLLEELANLDPLTEVPNRERFRRELEIEWRQGVRRRSPLSVALVDLDDFGAYNAARGRPEGDRALWAVARALCERVRRPRDLIARHGADRFAVLLPETPAEGAQAMVRRMQEGIAALGLVHVGGGEARPLSASAGGVSVAPPAGLDPDALVAMAAANLDQARHDGPAGLQWSDAGVRPTSPAP